MFSKQLSHNDIHVRHCSERILCVDVKLEDELVGICNVYGPNNDLEKKDFLMTLNGVITDNFQAIDNFCIAGDFNIVLQNDLDIISGNRHNPSIVSAFQDLTYQLNVFDVWRSFHPTSREFTWSRSSPFTVHRLDYILCTEPVCNLSSYCDMVCIPGSDHKGVELGLQLSSAK